MKIPITKYGLPQVAAFPAMILAAMAVIFYAGTKDIIADREVKCIEIILFIVLAWVLAFFRDPHRDCPKDDNLFLSPADGKISDIEIIDHPAFESGRAIRIGIFLSIFNVHINRVPCSVQIDKIEYKEGQFKNAIDPESARVNESNDIEMTRLADPKHRLIVRQISGAIARRIVCDAKAGREFTGGDRFGMIKFGSRTELYLPDRNDIKVVAEIGQNVKAGLSILAEYENV